MIRQIARFIASHFRLPRQARDDRPARPAGELRQLMGVLGYDDDRITWWLWEDSTPSGPLATQTLAWGALIEGHLRNGSCDCADEEKRRHPRRRQDYLQKKRDRCRQNHALAQQPNSGLNEDEFVYRASVGVKHPLHEIRGFIDSMLFPLIITPGERRLTWERVDGKTIVMEWEAFRRDPRRVVPARTKPTRVPVLICRQCKTFVRSRDDDACRDERHLWELTFVELPEEEIEEDINARFQKIPINCCTNDDGGRRPHFWHPEAGVRCPACGLRRRRAKKYSSVPVYVPLDESLFPP